MSEPLGHSPAEYLGRRPGDFGQLSGLRVLLVEDEMMLSMLVEDWLVDEGCVVVGPAATLERARLLAGSETIDAAILDVNLGGQSVYEVAEVLATRGIPFVFTTGYAASEMDRRFRVSTAVQKPFRNADLLAALHAVCKASIVLKQAGAPRHTHDQNNPSGKVVS